MSIISNDLKYFAGWFGDHYKIHREGEYYSGLRAYKIVYRDQKEGDLKFIARVSNVTKTMEVQRDVVCAEPLYNKDFMYFLVIWCFCVNELKGDYQQADMMAIKHCLEQGKSGIDIYTGFIKFLEHAPSQTNENRIRLMGVATGNT
jgi:hypothetical protein